MAGAVSGERPELQSERSRQADSAHGCPFADATGFITMTPQLFINYKLKSVAHLPWRMLTYKALNTFIDDLFAFVIKMPVMYRIGCLRDGEAGGGGGGAGGGGGWPQPSPSRAGHRPGLGAPAEGLSPLCAGLPHPQPTVSWAAPSPCPLAPPPDVVFFIYLYQRWIYRVDPTRVNEFGMSGEAPTAAAPVAEAPTAAGALPPAPATASEEASVPLPAKPTQGACSASEPQEAPPKPAEDKKRD